MNGLKNELRSKIEKLCEIGDEFAQQGRFAMALKNYWTAYDLLPEPKEEWLAGTWILVAIGDTNFLHKDFQAGATNLAAALNFPSGTENQFLHLRLGQCYYELGKQKEAIAEFMKVYANNGLELFEHEDQKYFETILSILMVEALH